MSLVVDANFVASLAVPLPYSELARGKIDRWKRDGERILAPLLWEYELTTILRKAIAEGLLKLEDATIALRRILALNIEGVLPAEGLHLTALEWAARLGQSKAYDAHYLALANSMGADFWTADRRLVNRAQQLGVTWVHWIGEEP